MRHQGVAGAAAEAAAIEVAAGTKAAGTKAAGTAGTAGTVRRQTSLEAAVVAAEVTRVPASGSAHDTLRRLCGVVCISACAVVWDVRVAW